MSGQRLRVSIVGGGIGGMSAGIMLRRAGLDVTVYERAPELAEVGAGVQLTPNGYRVLESAGLGPQLAAITVPFQDNSSYYRRDGSYVGAVVTSDSQGRYPVAGVHRADLLAALADSLADSMIRTDHRCVGMEQAEDSIRLAFENGQTVESDIVIGADGIQSSLQQYVTPPSQPIHSGSVAFRGLLPATALPDWPRDAFQLWMGDGKHLLTFPVRGGEIINYVAFVPNFVEAEESWSAPGDPDQLRTEFTGWDERVTRLLDQVTDTFWWGLYDREPLPRWTEGRLTLLGDAAHPMLPHLGQGANQAIEDAAALALMLQDATAEDVPQRLLAYEALRRPRTSQVQSGARTNGDRYDSRYADLETRDNEIANAKDFRHSLYDYDIAAATAEALSPAGSGRAADLPAS